MAFKNPKALKTFEKHLLSVQGSNKNLKELMDKKVKYTLGLLLKSF
jgi:hypothetical protein